LARIATLAPSANLIRFALASSGISKGWYDDTAITW
jgi:hypothetical protein